VASIVLVILAALILPRMTSNEARRARLEVDRVATLVSNAATRDALSSDRVALEYRDDPSTLSVAILRPEDPNRPLDSRLLWQPDRLLAPVTLDATRVERAEVDGGTYSRAPWRIVLTDPELPPAIQLVLVSQGARREGAWTVTLGEGALSAAVSSGDTSGRSRFVDEGAVDLDAIGMRDEPW